MNISSFLRCGRYLGAIAALALTCTCVTGAPVPVTKTTDSLAGSLRQAISNANAGDTILFQIPTTEPGYDPTTGIFTITLTQASGTDANSALVIAKDLTIDGVGSKILIARSSASGTPNLRIFNITAGTVTLKNVTIYNGYTLAAGGGILISNGAHVSLRGVAVGQCFASQEGGGVENATGAVLEVINSTFYSNTTNGSGRAIDDSGVGRIIDSTISSNPATSYPATAAVSSSGQTHVGNTIIAGNPSAGGGQSGDVQGAFVSEGYNFIGDAYGNGGSSSSGFGGSGSHDQVGTYASPANAYLQPIEYSSGPTPVSRPSLGSPVIDQGNRGVDADGNPVNVDQRGLPRPTDQPSTANAGDGSDIGAVEVGLKQPGPTFTVTTTAERDDGVCSTDYCTLLDAVNAANANSDANTITFAPGVSGTILNTLVNTGLNITSPVTITGPGARKLAISGDYPNAGARIFNIAASAGNVQLSGLSFANAYAVSNAYASLGGAIYNAAFLTVSDCTFASNRATDEGGAIYNDGSGAGGNAMLNLTNCTFAGNLAGPGAGVGGAIFSAGTTNGHAAVTLTNCTFDHNVASQYGGAIYSDGTGSGSAALTVTNCTFNQNSASSGFGGIAIDGLNPGSSGIATLSISDTILRHGASGNNLHNDGGTVTSGGHNISDDDTSLALTGTGDEANTDPLLDAAGLKNNGGPTDTVGLQQKSPAINNGGSNAPGTDQRGYARNGVSDIGAFEFGGIAPPGILKIVSITRQSGGSVALHGSADAFTAFTIQASPDLSPGSFLSIGRATADGGGTWQYPDNGAIGLTKRFYRAVFP